MRAISLVNRLEFDFGGNVVRNGVKLGDVDNDGNNELIVGNEAGELVIFKERSKWQCFKDLGFISCLAVGDVLNQGSNCLVVVTTDGWCYIYNNTTKKSDNVDEAVQEGVEQLDGQVLSAESTTDSPSSDSIEKEKKLLGNRLNLIHKQRIPANCKDIILADIDGDGLLEMVLGLTDRVVRSYRWYNTPYTQKSAVHMPELADPDKMCGRLVGLNKWECANQIGSITLHHSSEGQPSLLIAQPGGTFMRICCTTPVETKESAPIERSTSTSSLSETLPGSTIDYQFLGLSRMRNQNISTEIIGDLRSLEGAGAEQVRGKPYAVATLDGTIMLVQDEIILWAMAVDHQVFALTKLDVTGNGADDIVACAWDGQTYILDQHKNVVRFQLDEAVQAFESGYYTLAPEEQPVTCLVYVTFKSRLLVYYDVPLKEMVLKRFEPDMVALSGLLVKGVGEEVERKREKVKNLDRVQRKELVEYLLYGVEC